MKLTELRAANFRCFREEQVARLAPVTLLVGDNGTGKASFLALVRALWDVAYEERVPDFSEPPFNLGTFDEIAHDPGEEGGQATRIDAGFSARGPDGDLTHHRIGFRRDGFVPFPHSRRVESADGIWVEIELGEDGRPAVRFGTPRGEWEVAGGRKLDEERVAARGESTERLHSMVMERPSPYSAGLVPLAQLLRSVTTAGIGARPVRGLKDTTHGPTAGDIEQLLGLASARPPASERPFAAAPIRTRPQRTYEPSLSHPNAEGDYAPRLLEYLSRRDPQVWETLKTGLERFGEEAGLFDEISIKRLGGPFQIEVRRPGGEDSGGPWRNLVDAGWGVGRMLPVATQLVRADGPQTLLLLQPETDLHPSAQAALGTLCGNAAAAGRQLLIKTHSDHLIDRIRMDMRDERSGLRPRDCSLLYFQRRGGSVAIHSLGWDEDGNLIAQDGEPPEDYRQFFLAERERSIWAP